ncbi:MAG: hypothetical protein QOK40_624, partial [Miltoncostaeaceae bacterium]|nr:hypothetical protein [Miltoncostaeaceae bacterium]
FAGKIICLAMIAVWNFAILDRQIFRKR